ncbi:MAG: hypothetical protein E7672_01270 [Ruminococcaceae bacterium]|nr:hypothetical protein [Oscillospiraceae bacterium]
MKKVSILCDALPREIEVCGERFGIITDFRRWILAVDAFGDREIPDTMTKIRCVTMLVCPELWRRIRAGEKFPAEFYTELAIELLRFASCGEELSKTGNVDGGRGERSFDFTQDSEVIFASFMETYGIDLTLSRMHWWKFTALLRNLPEKCGFMRIVQLRRCDTSRIEDDSLRRRIRRAKAAVRIR